MLEILFLDIPLALVGYCGTVFLIFKYLEVSGKDSHRNNARDKDPRVLNSKNEFGTKEVKNAPTLAFGGYDLPLESAEVKEPGNTTAVCVPTDSILKRHYLSNLLTIATSIHPRPEESILKRHHRQLVLSLTQDMLDDPEKIESLEDVARENRRFSDRLFSIARENVAPSWVEPSVPSQAIVAIGLYPDEHQRTIPEESTLRRHFIQSFLTKLEERHPRPTDNTLIRHYNQWLDSEVDTLICQSV